MRVIIDHKVNPCNDVLDIHVMDEPGEGGACHVYDINIPDKETVHIRFQDGPIDQAGVNGITQEVLIAICIDRLRSFQAGQYSCRENALALTKLEEAQHWLHSRTLARMDRGVEGTHTV